MTSAHMPFQSSPISHVTDDYSCTSSINISHLICTINPSVHLAIPMPQQASPHPKRKGNKQPHDLCTHAIQSSTISPVTDDYSCSNRLCLLVWITTAACNQPIVIASSNHLPLNSPSASSIHLHYPSVTNSSVRASCKVIHHRRIRKV